MTALDLKNPVPRSPEWWLKRLLEKLDARMEEINRYDDYYRGLHRMAFATKKFEDAFGDTLRAISDNWTKLVIDAVAERTTVKGFRFGNELSGDKKAWALWQANDLDAGHQMGITESLINGESYGLVWPDESGEPLITMEHPSECIVEMEVGARRNRAAGLKRFVDDDGFILATVYLPDGLYKFRSERKVNDRSTAKPRWVKREVQGELWPLPNPFGVVPLVPIMNDPRMLSGGVSEIADAIPLQDAINKTIADMMIASEFVAAPQRWAVGYPIAKDENGAPIASQERLINRFWVSEDPETKFGQFAQADLSPYVKTIEMFVQHFASRTRTPPHYFALGGMFPSGDAIKSAETGLVAKSKRKMVTWGEAFEEILRLAFLIKGDKKRSTEHAAETIWADPESRTESEQADALGKKRALLSYPLEKTWQLAGESPSEIDRMKAMLKEERTWLPEVATQTASTQERETQIAAGQAPTTTDATSADGEELALSHQ